MNESKKSLYLLVIFFIFLGGYYFFETYTFNKQINELKQSIKTEQEAVDLMKDQILKGQQQKEDFDLNNYNTYIPKNSGIPNMMNFISQTAIKNNINIAHFEINNQPKNLDKIDSLAELDAYEATEPKINTDSLLFETLSIKLSINGDYNNVRSFLSGMYSGDRLFNLTKWQWKSTGGSGISINLFYDAYYYPNNNDLFPELTPIPVYEPVNKVNPNTLK